jgi:hypothetical protein
VKEDEAPRRAKSIGVLHQGNDNYYKSSGGQTLTPQDWTRKDSSSIGAENAIPKTTQWPLPIKNIFYNLAKYTLEEVVHIFCMK